MGGEEEMKKQEEEPAAAACDFCGERRAVVYCRADTARLCLSCDRHVHEANSVSSKHPRSLLCDACSSAPSSIFVSSALHPRVLCSNCDFDAHRHHGDGHLERRPVDAFSGCPTAAELVSALGVGDQLLMKKKSVDNQDHDELSWVWDTPTVVRLDDLIVPTSISSSHRFQAIGVPPPPKNRNLACGKNKEEILQQVRELMESEGDPTSNDFEEAADPIPQFQSDLLPQNHNEQANNCFEANELQWNSNDWHEAADPALFPYDGQPATSFPAAVASFPGGVAELQVGVSFVNGSDGDRGHQIVAECLSPLTPKRPLELLCPDRDSVISRYKEKRKTRRYDKLIRYESRKARADTRVRIKGRFAKVNEDPKR